MGKGGRKPKPTAEKEAMGITDQRRINENEPQYEASLPECPEYLNEYATEQWNTLVPILFKQGLMTDTYVVAFTTFCEAWGRWREAVKQLSNEKLTIPGRYEGQTTKNPLIAIIHEAYSELKQQYPNFGLTPADAQNVNAKPLKPKEDNTPKSELEAAMRGENIIPLKSARG